MDNIILADMLDAKERRVSEREKLLSEHDGSALSVLLNIPGPIKTSVQYERAFNISLNHIRKVINTLGIQIIIEQVKFLKTGPEAVLILNSQAPHIKKTMMDIESNHVMGRLLDLDVYDNAGLQLSRTEFNEKTRKCLLCDNDAKICSRTRKHDINDLLIEIDNVIDNLS